MGAQRPRTDLDKRSLPRLEIVMNEMRKNQTFHFDLQIHPTLLNSTCLHCQMAGFIPIRVHLELSQLIHYYL